MSSGAPQVAQFVRPGSFWALHHWHSIRSIRATFLVQARYAATVAARGKMAGRDGRAAASRKPGCAGP